MMGTFTIVAIAGAALVACASPQQTAGTTTGAVAGAVVGGPVGAVVGGVAGAAVTAPGTPLGAGQCYVTDRSGRVLVDRAGRPRTRRC